MNNINSINPPQTWNACGYVRLSHEDSDLYGNASKEESNSIKSQKDLIRDYFSRHPELVDCGMRVDDGFSGSSFKRPSFNEMMADVKAGKINCIVVKDLSRFGRNYLDAGEYIERIFPFLGVRFIAINDNYDSLHKNTESDELVIPFKNLINEAYCRDTSIKIRSQLETKRRRGDFTGAFAVYGYKKDDKNKNHLVIDDFAADVVRDIFRWKLDGISAEDIADRLNKDGILSPMDYKKSLGLNFATPFCVNARSSWNATTILRILKNPVYTGMLEQGKNTTPSYKVKRRIGKPKSEWNIVEGTHEAVIERSDFEIVQKVLALDTRTSPGGRAVELFSGMVYCGECGAPMVRKTVPSRTKDGITSGGKKYVYYVCAAHKNEKTCSPHSLRDSALEAVVLESVKKQIHDVINMEKLLSLTETAALQKTGIKKQQERLDRKQEEISRYQKLLFSLYENLAEGVIDREEYKELKKNYSTLLEEAEMQSEEIRTEMNHMLENGTKGMEWAEQFKKHRNITELDRAAVVSMIERIFIYRDRRIGIVYNWQDEFMLLAGLLTQAQNEDSAVPDSIFSKKQTLTPTGKIQDGDGTVQAPASMGKGAV